MQFHHHRYSYYDQLVSLRMLPLQRLVLWTRRLRAQVFKSADIDPRVVFAGTRLGGFCRTGYLAKLHVFGRASPKEASVVNLQGIPRHLSWIMRRCSLHWEAANPKETYKVTCSLRFWPRDCAGSFNLKKLLVVDCGSGIVKACLADKRKACDAVPADEQPGAGQPSRD